MGEVIDENDLGRHIRYRHRISRGELVERRTISGRSTATRTDTGESVAFTANFLWMCQGYYRHSEGYTPEWDGMETFKGQDRSPAAPGRRTWTTTARRSS